MSAKKLTTKYAPAKRATKEELEHQISFFQSNKVLNKFLEKIPAVFLIVNKYRQIVYMNKGALEFTGLDDLTSVIGKRPGELIGCVHSTEEEGGCGTSESCTYCGAINAVLESQKGKPAVKDCRLVLDNEIKAFDLRVWASPLKINKQQFTAITLQDIQHEKWRSFLERIFFHDILNIVTGLHSTLYLLRKYKDDTNMEDLLIRVENITQNLIEDIQSQQLLIMAEDNSLEPTFKKFNSMEILYDILEVYENHNLSEGKTIKIAPQSETVDIISDRILLRRVLSNMIKNALEATPENGTVTLGCTVKGKNFRYWVHNPGFIPRDIQLQIFNRSFSTKGPDRGLGTYSMKLLSSFLDGKVTFTTSKENGTTFKAEYPIKLEKKLT